MNYAKRRRGLIKYLKLKIDMEDWHGVADAACDLRELEAYERAREEINVAGILQAKELKRIWDENTEPTS